MIIYAEWPVIHSDDVGLEARRNPEDPEEYGINRPPKSEEDALPMMFLPRGSLKNIATDLPLREGNDMIVRKIRETRIEEYQKVLDDSYNITIINAFVKSTYINLAQQGKIMI